MGLPAALPENCSLSRPSSPTGDDVVVCRLKTCGTFTCPPGTARVAGATSRECTVGGCRADECCTTTLQYGDTMLLTNRKLGSDSYLEAQSTAGSPNGVPAPPPAKHAAPTTATSTCAYDDLRSDEVVVLM